MSSPPIPDKLYFRIGEVAELVGVKPHVLRYWEEEFPVLRPGKSRTQQRLYRRKDIEFLLRLKELLYDRGFTIAGARRYLRAGGDLPPDPQETTDLQTMQALFKELRADLVHLRDRLQLPPDSSSPSPSPR